jgi:xylulokinase
MITLSTGAQVMRPTASYTPDPVGRWHTWPAARPPEAGAAPWLSVGALLNGGRAIDWIHRTLAPGIPIADLMDLAQAAPVGSGNLLFLPYLAGERSPLLDPYARGAFIGLDDGHEPGHLVRAVLEGVALAIAHTLDLMTPEAGRPARIVFGGGGASRTLRQIVASVLGVPLIVPPTQESSALGAATIAAHTLRWHELSSEAPWNRQPNFEVAPHARDHRSYEALFALFREATDSLLPIMHQLRHLP